MKKVLIALLVIVVLVVGAVVALPLLIPTETYKAEIARRVEAATGRELVIGGDLDFSVLPTVALTAEDVRLANVPGAAEPDMAHLRALQVELEPWPLLRGEVAVDRFVLVEPRVHLQIDAQGRPNWRLGDDGDAAPQPAGQQPVAGAERRGDGAAAGGPAVLPIAALRLGEVRIENGALTFHDARSGATERLEAVNAVISLPDLQGPLAVDGSLRYEGEEVDLDLRVERPLAVIQGGASPLSLRAAAKPVEVRFEGEFENAATPRAAGDLVLDVASIRDLAAWLAAEPPAFEGEGLRTLAVAGRVEVVGNDLAFRNASLRLDDIEATGEVAVDLAAGPRPRVTGRLDIGALDLNPYLPPPAEEGEDRAPAAGAAAPPAGPDAPATAPAPPSAAAPAPAAGPADDGWSNEPIALPPVLGVADAEFELTVDSLRYRDIQTGPGALGLTLDDRTLRAQLRELALYDGEATGVVRVGAAEGDAPPAFRVRLDLAGVRALPLLRDAAGFERLEGTANAEFDLATRGLTERQLVSNLNGAGRLRFRDGAIDGINLAAMVRNVGGALLEPGAGRREVRKTDFAELGGTLTARNGVLSNDDLTLQAPLLRLAGAGTVDLPRRRIDYRIEPVAAPTIEGQGGRADVAGIMVPVVIEGPLEDPAIRPDLSGLIDQAIRDPEELRRRIEQLGEGAEDLRRGVRELTEGDGISRLIEGLGGGDEDGDGDQGDARRLPQVLDRLLRR